MNAGWETLDGPITMFAEGDDATLAPGLAERVERAWADEQREHPDRFDGELLIYAGRSGDRLKGRFLPYRYFVAQRRDPVLAQALALLPLGVSGMVVCEGQVAFGRRGPGTTQYPGWIELMPSGGIDRRCLAPDGTVDHRAQLLRELVEETGIAEADVLSIEDIALVRDTEDPALDVGSVITVRPGAPATIATRLAAPESEYRDVTWVPVGGLVAFLASRQDVCPTSRMLCGCYLARQERT